MCLLLFMFLASLLGLRIIFSRVNCKNDHKLTEKVMNIKLNHAYDPVLKPSTGIMKTEKTNGEAKIYLDIEYKTPTALNNIIYKVRKGIILLRFNIKYRRGGGGFKSLFVCFLNPEGASMRKYPPLPWGAKPKVCQKWKFLST